MRPDLAGFASPWEHIRLLSDRPRNDAMLTLLERRAPGARVVEVGCGTGLLSCVAAKLGAERVYAVEPTAQVEVARQLVKECGLSDRVVVIEGRVEDVDVHEVDLAFSELLNADPFVEGVLEASAAVRPWVVDGGHLAPRRLRVFVGLAPASGSAREARSAQAEIRRLAERYDLRLDVLSDVLKTDETYRYMTGTEEPWSTPAVVWDVVPGETVEVDEIVDVEVSVKWPGPLAGAVVWFEAELDDGIVLHNRPGEEEGHWGQLVCSFAEERGYGPDQTVRLRVELDEGEVDVTILEE